MHARMERRTMPSENPSRRLVSLTVVAMLLMASLFVAVGLAPVAAAAVTVGKTVDVVPTGSPYIRDDSTAVPIWGFGATSNNGLDRLSRVEVWFDTWNTNLNTGELKNLNVNGGISGVGLFRDTGAVDDVLDANDPAITVTNLAWLWNWPYDYCQLNLNAAANELVPIAITGEYHWFIVIRTDTDIDDNDEVRTWINAGGIQFSDGSSQPAFNIGGTSIDVRESRFYDIGTGFIGRSLAQAALSLTIVDGGSYDALDYLSLRFQNDGGFDFNDLAAIGVNPATSGVAVYRDDGTSDDSWDASDTGLVLSAVVVNGGALTVDLDINAAPVPNTPTGSYEYFIVVRTSATIANNDAFTIWADENVLRVDGTPVPSDQNYLTPEAGNNDWSSYRADTVAPSITSAYWSESSSYLHAIGSALWFSHVSTGTSTATANALASDNAGGSGVYYAEFSYEGSLGSGGTRDTSSVYQGSYSIESWDTAADSPATITMYDRAGNSATTSLSYTLDTTAPGVGISTPSPYDVLSGTALVRATASDAQSGVGTTWAQLSWDYGSGSKQMTWDGTAFTCDLDTTTLADGEHRLLVQIWDNVYNVGSAQLIVTVDNTGPTPYIVWPEDGRYVDASSALTVYAVAADLTGTTSMWACIDGGIWVAMSYSASLGVWSASVGAPGGGAHVLSVRGQDPAGNWGPTTGVNVIGDANDPTVTLVGPTDGSDVGDVVTIRVDADDAEQLLSVMVYISDGTITYALEAELNPATGYYELAVDTKTLHDGSWGIAVAATDEAGRVATTPLAVVTVDNAEPVLAISSPVNGAYVVGTYTVSASASDAGAGFDIGGVFMSVDGGDWVALAPSGGAWSVAWDTTGVADGAHTLTIVALDDAGNYAARAVTVYVDNTDPNVDVVAPLPDDHVSGTMVFAVSAIDNIGLRDVTVAIMGPSWTIWVTLGYNAASGYYEWTADTTLWPDGNYSIMPFATELTGRIGPITEWVDFYVDNSPPGITVSAPRDGEIIVSRSYVVAITATDGPFSVAAAAVEYRVDDGNWRTMNAGASPAWSITWDTTEVADGTHTLTFRATDLALKVTERTVTVTVDNHDPEVALVTPSEAEHVGGTYTFTARAADLLGVWSVEMHFGFTEPGPLEDADATYDPSTGFWELTVDTTTLPDGPASIVLVAVDMSGRTRTTELIPFAVDNAAPRLILVSPAPGEVILDGALNITVTATDQGFDLGTGDVEYNLDGVGWKSLKQDLANPSSFSIELDWALLPDGLGSVEVRVTDGAGHVTSTTVGFTVDNIDPTCRVVSPAPGEFAMGVYHFRVAASDRLGISGVELVFTGVEGLTRVMSTYNPASGYWEFLIDTTTLADALAEVSARAMDSSGRWSAIYGPVDFTIDNAPPELAFGTPSAGEVITTGEMEVLLLTSDAPFELAAGDVELSVDGGGWMPVPLGEGDFWWLWDTSTLPDAWHLLSARVTDAAGHVTEDRINVIVDNHDPTLGVVAPTEGQFASGVLLFKVAASDARGIVEVTLGWSDADPVVATLNAASNYYEYTLDTTTLADGNYTLVTSALDTSGRTSTVVVVFQVDNNEPELSLDDPLPGDVLEGMVTVTATVRDTFIDTLQFSVDGVGWVDMVGGRGSFSSSVFADGPHTIIVRAIDGSGKEVHASSPVTLDNNAPAMSVASFPSPGEHVAGDVPFALFVKDAVAVASVKARVGADVYDVYLSPASGFYEWALPSAAYADGELGVTFVATDTAAHNATLSWTVVVDNSAPALAAMSPTTGASVKGDVVFKVDATDATGVESAQIRIGSGPWVAMTRQESGMWLHTWTTTVSDNEDGLVYTVRLTDSLGNSEDVSATIDVANPDYAWVAILILVVFVILVAMLVLMRRRKERMEAVLEPEVEEAAKPKGGEAIEPLDELEELISPPKGSSAPKMEEVEVELEPHGKP